MSLASSNNKLDEFFPDVTDTFEQAYEGHEECSGRAQECGLNQAGTIEPVIDPERVVGRSPWRQASLKYAGRWVGRVVRRERGVETVVLGSPVNEIKAEKLLAFSDRGDIVTACNDIIEAGL